MEIQKDRNMERWKRWKYRKIERWSDGNYRWGDGEDYRKMERLKGGKEGMKEDGRTERWKDRKDEK